MIENLKLQHMSPKVQLIKEQNYGSVLFVYPDITSHTVGVKKTI